MELVREYSNEIYIKNGTSDGSWGLFKPVKQSDGEIPLVRLLMNYSKYISDKNDGIDKIDKNFKYRENYSDYENLISSYNQYLNNRMSKDTLIKLESSPGYYINYNVEENIIKEISDTINV